MHKSELQDTSPELLEQVLTTNLLGSIYGARAALQASHPPSGHFAVFHKG